MLLAGGCDPNVRGLNELTPLLLASHYGYHDIVKLLLKYGADVGLTALVSNICFIDVLFLQANK